MTEKLAKIAAKAINEIYGQEIVPVFVRTNEEHGDFATNVAMQLAGKLKKPPRDIAEALAAKLREDDYVNEVAVAGPGFINIRVKSSELASVLNQEISRTRLEEFGSSDIGSDRTILCEFPSPNMAKPFSVGHIRAALQGWAIHKLMLKMGYNVITDNHLGDSGTPFGKWVVGFIRLSSDEKLNQDGIQELSRIYIAITEEMKLEKEAGKSEIADEVQQWLKKLEAQNPEAVDYSQRFNSISLQHMHQVMDRLRIKTDYELGESQFVVRGQEMVEELLSKGIAEVSDGAVIVRLDEYGIDTPVMLRKANGAALYATTDLATIEYRQNTWDPEKVFIHTGQEQAFYFRQLKALAKKCGFKDNINHLWHGLVDQLNQDGQREKMSSRKGVILLNDLLDAAEAKAEENMESADKSNSQEVALGALKFTDFTADRKNGVLFDWNNMFNVHGFSGPAIQYSSVRIKSILKKSDRQKLDFSPNYDWQSEHRILLLVLEYPGLLLELHSSYELHKLASYLYELAREFNRYYEKTPILKADDLILANRLWLISAVLQVFESGLDILGIPTPEEM